MIFKCVILIFTFICLVAYKDWQDLNCSSFWEKYQKLLIQILVVVLRDKCTYLS